MSPPREREKKYAQYLQGLVDREDRAALAALRRGLGKRPGEVAGPLPYVVPWLTSGDSPWAEECYFLVGALFALHQGSWEPAEDSHAPTNLGASLLGWLPLARAAGPRPALPPY